MRISSVFEIHFSRQYNKFSNNIMISDVESNDKTPTLASVGVDLIVGLPVVSLSVAWSGVRLVSFLGVGSEFVVPAVSFLGQFEVSMILKKEIIYFYV